MAYSLREFAADFIKFERFDGANFQRWQKNMHFLLASLKVVYVLTTPCPSANEDETIAESRAIIKWEHDDYICKGHIYNAMTDTLCDAYQNKATAKDLWDALEAKYLLEDTTRDGTLNPPEAMKMYPALSIQRSDPNQLSILGASGAMSSSFPALPRLLDDKDSNYTDSFHVSSGWEPMKNPISTHAASLVSNSSINGQLHTSSPILPHDVHFSSVLWHGRHPEDSPFISLSSTEEASFPPSHSSRLDAQSAVLVNHLYGNQDSFWRTPVQDLISFPENVSVQNGQVESSTDVMISEDHPSKTDLEWVDEWITSNLEADRNELPDVNVADPKPKHSQIHQQQQPVPSGEFCGVANTFSNAPPSKSRMHWTPELHEAFVEAVNQLGGSEWATSKCIKNLMNVEGLTIDHVKSHLQKYRTVRSKQDPPEGTSEKKLTPTEELKSVDLKARSDITEALRFQMELQKRLHDLLEKQKKLQLEIEKHGQYLQEILFKEQRRMEDGRTKASVSSMDNPSAPLPNMVKPTHVDDKSETSKADQVKSGPGTSSVKITPENYSWYGSRKQKAHETRNAEDQEQGDGDSKTKRARGHQRAMS